ncbi:MAG: S-layer homology domain-containing protein [Oscillospiraceae bacterium]|jgi:hypothetical protein|nr:S-layer homology domain-containing protein [Oscillospiraceae bacterium]
MKFKRILTAVLACVLTLAVYAPAAFAIDSTKHFDFEITADGGSSATIHIGDTITVAVTLTQKNAKETTMFALRDKIIFDGSFFDLVPDSIKTETAGVGNSTEKQTENWSSWVGVSSTALAQKFDGDTWASPTVLVTFQLTAKKAGTSVILHRDHVMSDTTGLDEYDSTATDATVVIRNFPYTDVAVGAWYRKAVEYVSDERLIDGSTATKFDPESALTRGTLVIALYRKDGSPAVSGNSPFTDVTKGTELDKAAAWASDAKIVNGVGDNKFDPNGEITREQIAAMFYRYATFKKSDTSAKGDLSIFTDSGKISSWAKDALVWANGEKLINGNGDGTVAPQGTATRAQVAQILLNYTKR